MFAKIKKLKKIVHYARWPALVLIMLYQRLFSPDHSFWSKYFFPRGYCRYRPSCSEYGKLAIKKYGLFKGGSKAVWRVLRCNPWGKGGEDLP